MTRFLATRLLLLVVGLVVASAIIFFSLRVLPGDVATVVAGAQASPEQVKAIRSSLGLNEPVLLQYWDWIRGLARLHLGTSLVTDTPVASELGEKLEVTLPLAFLSLVIGLLVGIPLGILSALRHRKVSGFVISASAQLVASIPIVWAGVLLITAFGLGWAILPVQGFPQDNWKEPGAALLSLVLPALTVGFVEGAILLRFTRSAALEALNQDYVRTAAAKGLTRSRALIRHGLPNVLLSVISVLGIQIAGLIVGAVIVEQLFQLPGVGRMLVTDVSNRDLPKVQSELLALTGLILVVGFFVDIIHRILDPRQREHS